MGQRYAGERFGRKPELKGKHKPKAHTVMHKEYSHEKRRASRQHADDIEVDRVR
jgi:hypothetical protein